MKPISDTISIQVVNNTPIPQDISILGGTVDTNTNVNESTTFYSFDLSTEDFIAVTKATLRYKTTTNPTIITLNGTLNTLSISGVVDVLNSFNKGVFTYSGTTIYAQSSFYIYLFIAVS